MATQSPFAHAFADTTDEFGEFGTVTLAIFIQALLAEFQVTLPVDAAGVYRAL